MRDLYSNSVLDLAANIPHIGRLAKPDATGHKVSRICGSEIVLDLMLNKDRKITQIGLEVKACALGQASTSIFSSNALGADITDILNGRNALETILQGIEFNPTGRFSDLSMFAPVAPYRQRHSSIFLVFDAAFEALKLISQD